MSTRGTISYITITGAFAHFYTECFDDNPEPVYIEMWEQGEHTNHSMTVCMPQEKALQLADDLTKWAAGIREWNAREEKEKP